MGEYLSPGVYIEEVSTGAKPLEAVSTSTAGFVIRTKKGKPDTPAFVTSWKQFEREFGGHWNDAYGAYSVYSFFENGGRRAYVVRICGSGAAAAISSWVTSSDATPVNLFKIQAASVGAWANTITVVLSKNALSTSANPLFDITIKDENNVVVESFIELSPRTNNKRYVINIVNGASTYIEIVESACTATTNNPAFEANDAKSYSLSGGSDGSKDSTALQSAIIGDSAKRTGIYAFDAIDDINILVCPELAGNTAIIAAMQSYCSNRKDLVAIVDSEYGKKPTEIRDWRMNLPTSTSYGILYYPWIQVRDPLSRGQNPTKFVPPSGAMAGVYARTDNTRGVHKAPAGLEANVFGALGVAYNVSRGEQDILNPVGINCIRAFPGTGVISWGARTLSSDSEWRYVNVRRWFVYAEETILKGIQWAVFEPNDEDTWRRLRINISAFLYSEWRAGALVGNTPAEAFFVTCDATTNPQVTIDQGKLFVEIGCAISKPGEFIIVRIGQWDGGRLIAELGA